MMKILKAILLPFLWFVKICKKISRRILLVRMHQKLERSYQKQLILRKELRKEINLFLREYFGLDANSKYIPADFKNTEEVKMSVMGKYGDRMSGLSLGYSDLFR